MSASEIKHCVLEEEGSQRVERSTGPEGCPKVPPYDYDIRRQSQPRQRMGPQEPYLSRFTNIKIYPSSQVFEQNLSPEINV
jgi:hypothetical protein